jgi:hypothetical protein
MSLTCKPTQTTPPSYLARKIQQTYRDIGLSPVFNVNTDISPCVEDFTSPTYYMSGATKPTTGLTITSDNVYNVSEVNDFDLTFNFTGSTDYTGYTGQFCYSVTPSLEGAGIEKNCVRYSGITGNTLVRTILPGTDVSIQDNTFTIRPWDVFIPKCLTDSRGRTGKTSIDTSNFEPIDTSKDDYFVTVTNPPKPLLVQQFIELFSDIDFVNEILFPEVEGSTDLLLSNPPVGNQAVVSVNGITLSSSDYTIDGTLLTINNNIPLEFGNPVNIDDYVGDIVHVYYNKSNATSDAAVPIDELVKLEIFSVTGITTGLTSNFSATTYENIVNYNDTNDRLEIFLKENIDTGVQPILKVNGLDIAFNIDFFKSNIVNNKLILNEGITLDVGDIITVYYYYTGVNKPGDLGILNTDTPDIGWSTFNNLLRTNISYGNFTVEITDRSDINYNNILKTGTTLYYNDNSDYNLTVGPITTTSVKDYIYRVKFDKYFVDEYNNSYQTTSYSENGSFKLNWNYINNTKF